MHWSYTGTGSAASFTTTTTDAGWDPSTTFLGPNSSSLPSGLTGNVSAFFIGNIGSPAPNNYSEGAFNGAGKPYADAEAIRTAVMNKNNWDKYYFGGAAGRAAVPTGHFGPVSSNAQPTFSNGSTQTLTACQNSIAVSIINLLKVNESDAGQTMTWSVISAASHGTASASYKKLFFKRDEIFDWLTLHRIKTMHEIEQTTESHIITKK